MENPLENSGNSNGGFSEGGPKDPDILKTVRVVNSLSVVNLLQSSKTLLQM